MILREIAHVIIIVKRMGIAVLINIHAHATPKLQEILLVPAILKLVLAIQYNVVITVRLIETALSIVMQIVLMFVLAKGIHVHVTLIVLQMMSVLTCVDVIIFVHVIHKL